MRSYVVAAHLAVLETRPDQPARLALALRLVRLLLQRGFSQDETDGLYRLLEAVIPESRSLAEAFDAEVARLEEEHAVKLITSSEMRGIKKGRQEGRLGERRTMLQGFASARVGEAAGEIAEALESIGDPEVLLRLAGTVATATSAAEVLAAIQRETQGASAEAMGSRRPLQSSMFPRNLLRNMTETGAPPCDPA